MNGKLTTKEEIFAQVYARTDNATLAYKKAGYSLNMADSSIWVKAHFIKEKDKVRVRIEELREEISKKATADLDRCNLRLMNIITANIKDLFETGFDEEKGELFSRMKEPDELDIRTSEAVKKVKIGKRGEIEYELYSPIEAIRQLASINAEKNLEFEYKLLENLLDKLPDEAIDKIARKVKNLHNLKRIEDETRG